MRTAIGDQRLRSRTLVLFDFVVKIEYEDGFERVFLTQHAACVCPSH